jgi:hypothetical protein
MVLLLSISTTVTFASLIGPSRAKFLTSFKLSTLYKTENEPEEFLPSHPLSKIVDMMKVRYIKKVERPFLRLFTKDM